jgi:hypothetical protein
MFLPAFGSHSDALRLNKHLREIEADAATPPIHVLAVGSGEFTEQTRHRLRFDSDLGVHDGDARSAHLTITNNTANALARARGSWLILVDAAWARRCSASCTG